MKPVSPHDPLDDLIAAALHGDLTPEERIQFEVRLSNDPAAHAAYQEALAMHDLLEKTHQNAQPDEAFEQRMVSGVRRKLQKDSHRETAWESLVVLWRAVTRVPRRFRWLEIAAVFAILAVLASVVFSASHSSLRAARRVKLAQDEQRLETRKAAALAQQDQLQLGGAITYSGGVTLHDGQLTTSATSAGGDGQGAAAVTDESKVTSQEYYAGATGVAGNITVSSGIHDDKVSPPPDGNTAHFADDAALGVDSNKAHAISGFTTVPPESQSLAETDAVTALRKPLGKAARQQNEIPVVTTAPTAAPAPVTPPAVTDGRKLIRDAQLELEVKSYQSAVDAITAQTKDAGGYVDTSNAEKGGNGKLHGTIVVKVLPQNLDAFLLKLRDLGQVNNQSVSTQDVTKDYFDTQARLDNARRMETQLQELLAHQNSKVSDLLQVERELGRVRGQIEEMQGQLKLYDFQVQYATVTIRLSEKDLNQAAAYLLKERDDFSLFSTDVEGTFQKARQAANDLKGEILVASLKHNSGTDVTALIVASVPPEQIDAFLDRVRSLGRVANFTRNTKREAKDGGETNDPADETKTEKDKVMVNVSIRPDDDSRKQVALTVVAKTIEDALDQAKSATLSHAGAEILNSSLNKTPEGQSTAQLSVRVQGRDYAALLGSFQGLGRTATMSIQRNDSSGPGTNGDDEPVIVALSLTDDDTPVQHTDLSIIADNVDGQANQIKQQAAAAGAEIKSSNFERLPDGTETAQMVVRLPMSAYPAFVETMKKSGKIESLTVHRDDRPDQATADATAPAEIALTLHNQGEIVPDNTGLWATLRETFGEGAGALFGSVKTIGVLVAFITPWLIALAFLAWVGRRIYVMRKK